MHVCFFLKQQLLRKLCYRNIVLCAAFLSSFYYNFSSLYNGAKKLITLRKQKKSPARSSRPRSSVLLTRMSFSRW